MVRINPNKLGASSAKVTIGDKVKYNFSKEEIKKFYDTMEGIQDKTKKFDWEIVLHYIINGGRIVLEKKRKIVHIYGKVTHGRVEPICTIERNPELFSFLKNLI